LEDFELTRSRRLREERVHVTLPANVLVASLLLQYPNWYPTLASIILSPLGFVGLDSVTLGSTPRARRVRGLEPYLVKPGSEVPKLRHWRILGRDFPTLESDPAQENPAC
jgi:hypothetical protein